MKLFYSNKEDPRVFVYKGECIVWGVTLNLAHRKSRKMMIGLLVILIVPILCLTVASSLGIASRSVMSVFSLCYVGIILVTVVISYIGAHRDLKRYPGPKGPR